VAFDLSELERTVKKHGVVVRVGVLGVQGSAPREAGASMLVWDGGQTGTIGGGTLEWDAAIHAQSLLTQAPWARDAQDIALGPELGQCCGGRVALFYERYARTELAGIDRSKPGFSRPKTSGAPGENGAIFEPFTAKDLPVYIYGAGHVGREIVRVLQGLPFSLTWVDMAETRFPEAGFGEARRVLANPAAAVADAPDNTLHFVMTHAHSHDLEICHQVLSRRFDHLGLIGSATKKVRFLKRLAELGHAPATLDRLQCPIGDRSLGKTPPAIAIGVAHWLMHRKINEKTTGKRGLYERTS